MKRISFSQDEKTIQAVWDWYQWQADLSNPRRAELRRQVQKGEPVQDPMFEGMTLDEVDEFFAELDHLAKFDLVSAAEAAIRIDFFDRVDKRRKDALSRHFRDIYKGHARLQTVRLDDDILDAWREHEPATRRPVSDFKGVLGLRHWLAHGRYWDPKLGRDYSPGDVYDIAFNLLQAMGVQ